MMHDMALIAAQESCWRYLHQHGIRDVYVNVFTKYGVSEPYLIYFAKGRSHVNEPFHVHLNELNKLIDGDGVIWGRTPWGPWCQLHVFSHRILSVFPRPEIDYESMRRYIYGEEVEKPPWV